MPHENRGQLHRAGYRQGGHWAATVATPLQLHRLARYVDSTAAPNAIDLALFISPHLQPQEAVDLLFRGRWPAELEIIDDRACASFIGGFCMAALGVYSDLRARFGGPPPRLRNIDCAHVADK